MQETLTARNIRAYQQRKRDRKVGSIGVGIWLDKDFHEHMQGYEAQSFDNEGVLPSFHEEFSS